MIDTSERCHLIDEENKKCDQAAECRKEFEVNAEILKFYAEHGKNNNIRYRAGVNLTKLICCCPKEGYPKW